MSNREKYLASLDIGSSKICCIIASQDHHDISKIIGLGYNKAKGISNGVISDFDSAISSLSSSNKFIDINALKLTKRPRSLIDHLFALFFWTKYEIKRILGFVKTDYNV